MNIQNVIDILQEIAPLQTAEEFDNVGLLVGNKDTKITGILITLDTLENVVDEAIIENCNLIISFHPIIFKGLKKINGKNYVEKTVIKAIKNDIAIFSMHTALDNSSNGVSGKMAEMLNLNRTKILLPKKEELLKLTTYIPKENAEKLLQALYKSGAGNIGNYSECSFNYPGISTFKGNEFSNPVIGEKNKLKINPETCINVIFEKHKESKIIKALFENHIYEEIAYEIIPLNNVNQQLGMGVVGELPIDLNEKQFLKIVKETFLAKGIRHSKLQNKKIKKIAVLGGSGAFAIEKAKQIRADAYISADFKYHDFFKAEKDILLIDIGHYESEQFTKNLLFEYLNKKITNFATSLDKTKIVLSKINTNPINYL